MTTLPQQDTIKQYLGDGVTTVFTYPFMILANGDIDVYVTLAGEEDDPQEDQKILDVDYTVQSAGNVNGGTITFLVAPAALSAVTLVRSIEASVDTNFANATNFSGANLDYAFLRTTLVEQENRTYTLQRNLSYRVTSYFPPAYLTRFTQIPRLGTGQIWMGFENGVDAVTLEQNPDVSTLRSELANNNLGTDGARLIGYHDNGAGAPTTVHDQLNLLSQQSLFGTDTGTTNLMLMTVTTPLTAYYTGMQVSIIPANTNSNQTTLNINSLGAKNVWRSATDYAQPGDIVQNKLLTLYYDGTRFIMTNLPAVATGTMMDFVGTNAPAGYIEANGALASKTLYSALFAICGTTWGAGDATNFTVPNMVRRTSVGRGGAGTGNLGNAVGNVGGEENHALTDAENGPHVHTSATSPHQFITATGTTGVGINTGATVGCELATNATASSGSGTPHNTIQPSAIVMKIIKV